MTSRVLVTGAGTGAANNLIRSLKAGDPSLVVIGCHGDRFALTQSAADRNYLLFAEPSSRNLWGLRHVIEKEAIDLIIPSTDTEVLTLSRQRDRLRGCVFLPRHHVIERCQDKYRLACFLRAAGVPAPETFPVTDTAGMRNAFRRLTASQPLVWCRPRRGNGGVGAAPVRTLRQARAWIAYWKDMRGIPEREFTLAQFLPGRDFACQSLWRDGQLVLIKTFERLSYVVRGSAASSVSSLAALMKMVYEPRVVEVCKAAIRQLDRRASGVFCVDLKESADGTPCVTEINAGRFSMSTNVYDLTGRYNMALAYLQLARKTFEVPPETYDVVEDHYMVRDLDGPPRVLTADALFDRILDATGEVTSSGGGRSSPKRRRTSHGRLQSAHA